MLLKINNYVFKILLILVIFLIANKIYADEALSNKPDKPSSNSSNATNSPLELKLSAYILNISSISTQMGTYTMDFYLDVNSNKEFEATTCRFEVLNGKINNLKLLDDSPKNKVYRINASLISSFDFRNYPFDNPKLTLILEDELLDLPKLVYIADNSKTQIDSEMSSIVGWEIKNIKSSVKNHYYQIFDQAFSSYKLEVTLARPILAAVLNNILPGLIVAIIGLCSCLIDPKNAFNRTGMITSSLICLILFHLSLKSNLPQLSYLTFIDKFMFINYLTLLACVITAISIMILADKDLPKAYVIYESTKIIIPILWIIPQIINVIFIF